MADSCVQRYSCPISSGLTPSSFSTADNIDYEEIKHFIKENTTPGKGKAISIPGTGDETAKGFEDSLYSILDEQHDRISSFVKSKAGEINRRLGRYMGTSVKDSG